MTRLRSAMVALMSLTLLAGVTPAAMGAEEAEAAEPMASSAPMSPEGVTWLLAAQAIDGVLSPLAADVPGSLVMADGRAGGDGGCNSFFASYELAGPDLTFREIGATMMFCEGPAGEAETAYLGHLSNVATWAMDGGTLTLSDGDGMAILEFRAAPPASVVGSWLATGVNDGAEAVASSTDASTITAEFSEDGTLAGVDGCNDYSTTYSVDGSAIAIAPEIRSTRMACRPDEIMERAQQYLAALVAASSWSVNVAGVLELRDADGTLQVQFEPTG